MKIKVQTDRPDPNRDIPDSHFKIAFEKFVPNQLCSIHRFNVLLKMTFDILSVKPLLADRYNYYIKN